jgi:hypothetical protein
MTGKEEERKMLESVNEQLSKLDEVECEYYFDKDDDYAPVLIFHQDCSFVPLFILRPKFHSMSEIKNFIITDVEEYECYEDACYKGTKDNEYIMKYYKEIEQ